MLHRHVRLCFVSFLTAAAWACAAGTGPDSGDNRPISSTRPSTSPDDPVIALWNDGVHLLNIKPFLLFAAWADGRIVRQQRYGVYYTGKVPPAEVEALMTKVRDHGLFDPPLDRGWVVPDGPSQTIIARHRGRSVRLSHDSGYDWSRLNEIGPNASPSRKKMEDFLTMWIRAQVAMDEVAPDRLDRIKGDSPLTRPAR
jgi:hypothetical protein